MIRLLVQEKIIKRETILHSRKKKEKMYSEDEDTEDIIFGL